MLYFSVHFIIEIWVYCHWALTKHWGHDYTLTLHHFSALFDREWKPFVNSIRLAIGVAGVSSGLGVMMAYIIKKKEDRLSKWLELIGTLPAAVPGILFGIGYLVVFKYPLFGLGRFYLKSGPKIILLGTNSIIYIICVFRYLSVGLRAGVGAIAHQDPNIESAAYTLGASHLRTLRTVSIPYMLPAFQTAFMKNMTSTMTTLGAIIFLLLPSNKVAVQQIFQIITSSEIGLAAAMSLSLSALMGVLLILFHVLIHYSNIFGGRRNNER